MLPSSHAFEDLRSKLIFNEQRLKFQSNRDIPIHKAPVSTLILVAQIQEVVLVIKTIAMGRVGIMVDVVTKITKDIIIEVATKTTTPTIVLSRMTRPLGIDLEKLTQPK